MHNLHPISTYPYFHDTYPYFHDSGVGDSVIQVRHVSVTHCRVRQGRVCYVGSWGRRHI